MIIYDYTFLIRSPVLGLLVQWKQVMKTTVERVQFLQTVTNM